MAEVRYKAKQLIVMRRDLHMRKGKIAAQAGHACVEATLMALAREDRLDEVRVNGSWIALDHGESTFTCLAFEPLFPEQIDPITGDLPLF